MKSKPKKSVSGRQVEHRNGGIKNGQSPVIRAFAGRMRTWRQESGFPLKRVAKDLGVSVSIVSEWEHGHRFPSVGNLEAIAKYIEVPACHLLYIGPGDCKHPPVRSR